MERQRKGCRKHKNKQSQSCRESSIHRSARLPQIVDATYWFLLTSDGWTTQRTAMIWQRTEQRLCHPGKSFETRHSPIDATRTSAGIAYTNHPALAYTVSVRISFTHSLL